jgi:hypothetical protein
LTPLLSVASLNDAEKDKAEAVESCALEVRVDPSTGAVTATQSKGRSVSEAWGIFRGRLQLAFVLLLPFLLMAAYYFSGHVQEWWLTRQHTAWLLDFYQKNAPEVSSRRGGHRYICPLVTRCALFFYHRN